ncbi:MAG: HD domain-containing protein [Candidatus Gracilibacteria bacterium]
MPDKPELDMHFLSTLEKILLDLKANYSAEDIPSLEKRVLEEAKKNSANLDINKQIELLAVVHELWHAFKFAAEKHKNQARESGEPYIMHPILVALNEIYHQKHERGHYAESPIIAALLHDTIEDTDAQYEDLDAHFGNRVKQLVANLTNKPEWDEWKKKGQLSHTEKSALQFINAIKDPASLSVKFDDRTHNLDTIRYMPAEKQIKKILDTLSVGFIEKAESLGRFDFLIQLYITIQQYLTDVNIEQFAENSEDAKQLKQQSLTQISDILSRHHQEIFHR